MKNYRLFSENKMIYGISDTTYYKYNVHNIIPRRNNNVIIIRYYGTLK